MPRAGIADAQRINLCLGHASLSPILEHGRRCSIPLSPLPDSAGVSWRRYRKGHKTMWHAAFRRCCIPPLILGFAFTQELSQRATLKGIGGLQVSVLVIGLEESRNADLRSLLQVDVELRLRQNRIRVLEALAP